MKKTGTGKLSGTSFKLKDKFANAQKCFSYSNKYCIIKPCIFAESENMYFSYNKLWKMLIDRGWKKKDLRDKSGISSSSIAKLGKGGNVTTEVLLKICKALNCSIGDIMEIKDK